MRKILSWLGSGFFRKLGGMLVYLLIGSLIAIFYLKTDVSLDKLLGIDTVYASSYTITSVNLSDNSSVNNSTLFSNGNVYTTSSTTFYGFTYFSMPTAQGQLAESTYLITKVCSNNPITEEPYSSTFSNIFREVLTDNINCYVNGLSGKYYYLGGGTLLSGSGNGTYETGYFGAKYNAPSGTKLVYVNSIAYDSNEYVNFKNGLDSITLNSNQCSNILNLHNYDEIEKATSYTINSDNVIIVDTTDEWAYIDYSINVEQNTTYYLKLNSTNTTNKDFSVTILGGKWSPVILNDTFSGSYSTSFNTGSYSTIYIRFFASRNYSGNTATFSNVMLSKKNDPYCKFGSLSNPTNDLKDTLTDDNVSSDVSDTFDFFNEFNLQGAGNFTQIVLLPINFINTLILGNENDLCFTLKGQQACLPNGKILWNRNNTSCNSNAMLGCATTSTTSAFKTFFSIVVGGYLSYKLLIHIVHMWHKILDPTKDNLEVMKL